MREDLTAVYHRLYDHFGPRYWWPGDTPFEIAIGAILTQSVSWSNVEKAIYALKEKDALDPASIAAMDTDDLASLIRPTLYFNMKARKLKSFCRHLLDTYGGEMGAMQKRPLSELRAELLGLYGIGPETADSILLYAFEKPVFVVDAYTRRIFARIGYVPPDIGYDALQVLFSDRLPPDGALFNEYHALIVTLGKEYCTAKSPRCGDCPLKDCCKRRFL
jgi:endonuclease-3 related protein